MSRRRQKLAPSYFPAFERKLSERFYQLDKEQLPVMYLVFPGIMTSVVDLPKRPRFSWDIPSVPWPDGRGNQEDYFIAIRSWSAFHVKLPDSNSNKIPKGIPGIMLHTCMAVQKTNANRFLLV